MENSSLNWRSLGLPMFSSNSTFGLGSQTKLHDAVDILKLQVLDKYLLYLNLGCLLFFGLDKVLARKKERRVRDINLLIICLNAPLSSISSMLAFRHKLKHPLFYAFTLCGFYLMFMRFSFIYDDSILSWKGFGFLNFAFIIFSLIVRYWIQLISKWFN